MAAEIKVGVGADITGLEKGLKQGEKDLKTFASSVGKLDFDKKLTAGANQAGNALTNLGRVAQDAPFGFIGIQNNLSPLLESFQRLKAETGSTGGALKALGQSLIGPAGLGVAFSLVTAGITVLSQHPELLTNLFKGLTNETNQLSAAQRAYNDSLAESTSSVQGEIANINSLLAVARDENLSRNARLDAVKELNKNYPELNNQITLEGINSKKTTEAINQLNNALITRAKIQAVQELIGAAFKKQVESQNTALQSQASTMSKIAAFFQLALPVQGAFLANSTLIASGAVEQNKALKESEKQLSEYQKILNGLNASLAKSGNLFVDLPKKIKQARESINKEKGLPDIFNIQDQAVIKPLKTPPIDTSSLQIANDQIENRRRELKARLQLMGSDFIDFTNALNTGLNNAFGSLGESIGSALANGGNVLEAAGASLLGSLGGILQEFGKLTIAAGIAALGLQAVFKAPLNPASAVAAIAAGTALVAIGSAVKAFSGKVGSGGGSGGGSNYTPSVPSGFQASAPAGARATPRQDTFTLNTVIKGQDLALSLTRTQALNGRTG